MNEAERLVQVTTAIRRILYDRGVGLSDKVVQIHELTAPEKKSKGKSREEPELTGFDRQDPS